MGTKGLVKMSRGASGLPRLSGCSRKSRSRRPSPPPATIPCGSTHAGEPDADAVLEQAASRARDEAVTALMLILGFFPARPIDQTMPVGAKTPGEEKIVGVCYNTGEIFFR